MVNAYLARYCEQAGVDVVSLDPTGYAQLKRAGALVGVNVLEETGTLMILAPMFDVPASPKGGREALYRRLLELSFLQTADAAFAIDAKSDVVYARAHRRLSGLDYEEFEDLITRVGQVSAEWDAILRQELGA
jgi:hypothetical protein